MLFAIKWDATGITDEKNLATQFMSRDAATDLTSKLQAAGTLPPGIHAILGAKVDEDGGQEGGVCRVSVQVELAVEAEDPAAAATVGNDDFLAAIASAMVDVKAQDAYDLCRFVVSDINIHVDEPDIDLIAALAV